MLIQLYHFCIASSLPFSVVGCDCSLLFMGHWGFVNVKDSEAPLIKSNSLTILSSNANAANLRWAENISALAKPECPRASIARGCSVGCYGSITRWNLVVLTRYKELKKRENGNRTSERQLYSIHPLLPRCESSSLPGAQASQAPLGLARNIGSPITASCSGVSPLSVVSCYSRQL